MVGARRGAASTRPNPLALLCRVRGRRRAKRTHNGFCPFSVRRVRCVSITGDVDSMALAVALAKKPHVIVATPGRLIDHLENTKGFNLRNVRHLVLDEADRILTLDFEKELDAIVAALPVERRSHLFSATMTSKVRKLRRASLRDPVKVEVSAKYSTVDTLVQHFLLVPDVNETSTSLLCSTSSPATPLLCSSTRSATRNNFHSCCARSASPPVASTAACRSPSGCQRSTSLRAASAPCYWPPMSPAAGWTSPRVNLVVNFDIPNNAKDYRPRAAAPG